MRDSFTAVFGALAFVLLLFIAVPLVGMALKTAPSELVAAAAEEEVLHSLLLTLWAALLATVFGTVVGVPLAWFLARGRFRGRRLLEGLVSLPVVIPHSAAGIALLSVLGSRTLLGKVAALGGIGFVGTVAGIAAAMAFVSVPFLIGAATEAFRGVDPRLERIARTCGASPWRVFRSVTLPLAARGILSGMVLMWARGISEFGAVIILAYHPMIAPILIFERFTSFGLGAARPVAVLLILVCLVIFILCRRLAEEKKEPGDA